MNSLVTLLLLTSLSIASSAVAQITTKTNQIELVDNNNHGLILKLPTSGWPSSGTLEWTLPLPPTSVAGGFVEAGSATLTSLQWDNTNKFWKAVTGGFGGSGTDNFLSKWSLGGTELTNSLINDDGTNITIANAAFLLSGSTGATPASGPGERLMWIPEKSAFRAGGIGGAQWDDASIGFYSIGLGYNTTASTDAAISIGYNTSALGGGSVAMGASSVATGLYAVAIGYSAEAQSNYSIAIGYDPTASNTYATALGYLTVSSGDASTAMGAGAKASGAYSTATGYVTEASGGAAAAFGSTTLASGNYSIATGLQSTASGLYSVAMGYLTKASGTSSIALGQSTEATNDYSTALGGETHATGGAATAMGYQTNATGLVSTAMGFGTTASGSYSISIGYNTTASGNYSTAMGSYATNSINSGSFIYGDQSTSSVVSNTNNNQFLVRAAGGTIFYSDASLSSGVRLDAGQSAWATVSDSNRKENRLNIDGEDVLNKLSNIWIGSWNYKGQHASQSRHYGPMAQEFFAAFGNDGVGIIGNDTTLLTADVDGVTLIAVQALDTRDREMKNEITSLRTRIEMLEEIIRKMAGNDAQVVKAVHK